MMAGGTSIAAAVAIPHLLALRRFERLASRASLLRSPLSITFSNGWGEIMNLRTAD